MYLIIGSGRAATHFAQYLRLMSVPFLQWSRKTSSTSELKALLPQSTKVILLISDPYLEDFYKENLTHFTGPVIHFSGTLEIPSMISAHPLMTFGPDLYNLETYQKIFFALAPGGRLSNIFPELKNPSFSLPLEQKTLYHAWAVYSGNFATLLWKEALWGYREIGVPPHAVQVYLEQILKNVFSSPESALTGPLARKDIQVISKHLNSLPEPARSLYHSFVHSYAPELLKEGPP